MNRTFSFKNEDGYILNLSIILLFIMMSIGLALIIQGKANYLNAEKRFINIKTLYLAEAGVNYALKYLEDNYVFFKEQKDTSTHILSSPANLEEGSIKELRLLKEKDAQFEISSEAIYKNKSRKIVVTVIVEERGEETDLEIKIHIMKWLDVYS